MFNRWALDYDSWAEKMIDGCIKVGLGKFQNPRFAQMHFPAICSTISAPLLLAQDHLIVN